ncbi:MAG: acylphosphatase [Candidatus Hodarchaeales archaeon]
MLKRVVIRVTGRVQGVFFRVYTRDFARSLPKITGYVKNLRDGRVEILAEGDEGSLKKLVYWAKNKGSPYSQILKIEEKWENIGAREHLEFLINH